MIGEHHCRIALGRHVTLKDALAILLDELFVALEESFGDLTDEQAWAFPIPGHNNIAWIVMHALQNLDEYAVRVQTGEQAVRHDRRWDLWQARSEERPKPGDPFPTVREMLALMRQVEARALAALDKADDARLCSGDPSWRVAGPWRSDYYMRTINHAQAHLRQIWLLRGALGLTDGNSRRWPQQHWA